MSYLCTQSNSLGWVKEGSKHPLFLYLLAINTMLKHDNYKSKVFYISDNASPSKAYLFTEWEVMNGITGHMTVIQSQ